MSGSFLVTAELAELVAVHPDGDAALVDAAWYAFVRGETSAEECQQELLAILPRPIDRLRVLCRAFGAAVRVAFGEVRRGG